MPHMDLLAFLRNAENTVSFAAGQTIFQEGDLAETMYVVLEGVVTIKLGGQTVDTVVPGDLFGEMALVDSTPRSAAAVATTDCKLAPIDQERFEFLVQQVPEFARHIMKTMKQRILRHDRIMRNDKV